MFFILFGLIVSFSLANKNLNVQPQQTKFTPHSDFHSKLFLEVNLKDVECPEFDANTFTEITDETDISGNSYACNRRFQKPISIEGNLLQIYHCSFSGFKSNFPISIKTVSGDGSVFISYCRFFKNEEGCINLEDVNPKELKISYCQFTYCQSYMIGIDSIDSGIIDHCFFRCNIKLLKS